jgi:hypothetical protein
VRVGTQGRTSHAQRDGVLGRDVADVFRAAHPNAVAGEQLFVFIDARRHHLQEFLDALPPTGRKIQSQPADANVAGHHALAGDKLKNLQDLFALAEAVKKDGHRAQIDGMRPQPDQVRRNALQLHHHHADVLRSLGNLEAEQFLDRHAVRQIITQRIQVIDAVGKRDRLRIGFVFARFLDAGVQIAHVGNGADYVFAIQFQQNA